MILRILLLVMTVRAWAQNPLPQHEAISQRLEALNAVETPDAGQEKELELLRATQAALETQSSTGKGRQQGGRPSKLLGDAGSY